MAPLTASSILPEAMLCAKASEPRPALTENGFYFT